MAQEDKELLLKDLCARLPYGVFCVGTTYELDDDGERYIPVKVKDILSEIHNYKLETASVRLGLISSCKLETIKPYLRPMSDMTEEEKREIYDWLVENDVDWFDFSKLRLDEILISFDSSWLLVNWLLKNHFDYRGLIEKGLAIEVTKENNPYKN